jgi:hypothetical protein
MRKLPISYATLAGTAVRAPLALMLGGAVVGMSSVVSHASYGGASSPAAVRTVTATLIGPTPGSLRPGTVVRQRQLGRRVFADARHGFALASAQQAQYPAATVDGGKVWRIDGPPLHVNAAQAPLAVSQVGVRDAHTFFAWGGPGGGQVVDVTSDGGAHWWRTILGEVALAVVATETGTLTAVSQSGSGSGAGVQTSVYVSSDGGRHWQAETGLALS